MTTDPIEQEILSKGLSAPRILPADIEANIIGEYYFVAADAAKIANLVKGRDTQQSQDALACLTFCILTLRNGFTVTGEAACASPENFDAEIGQKIARQNAINKIWPLMGYELKSRLHRKMIALESGSTILRDEALA